MHERSWCLFAPSDGPERPPPPHSLPQRQHPGHPGRCACGARRERERNARPPPAPFTPSFISLTSENLRAILAGASFQSPPMTVCWKGDSVYTTSRRRTGTLPMVGEVYVCVWMETGRTGKNKKMRGVCEGQAGNGVRRHGGRMPWRPARPQGRRGQDFHSPPHERDSRRGQGHSVPARERARKRGRLDGVCTTKALPRPPLTCPPRPLSCGGLQARPGASPHQGRA